MQLLNKSTLDKRLLFTNYLSIVVSHRRNVAERATFVCGNFRAIRIAATWGHQFATNSMEDLFTAVDDRRMHSLVPFVFIAGTFEQPRNGKRFAIDF